MTNTDPQLKKNRLQLIAILAIVLIPILGSSFMFITGIGMPEGRNNHGTLIEPPVDLTDIELTKINGGPHSWGESGKFRFILLVDGACDETCSNLLYTTRQVHIRLSKRGSSLERYLVQLDDAISETKLADNESINLSEEYPRLIQLRSDFYKWRERLNDVSSLDENFNGHDILLADRRGNLIMVFDESIPGEEIHTDINFLIKSTQ